MRLLRETEQSYPLLWVLSLLADIVRGQSDSNPSTTHDATRSTVTAPTIQPTCESRTVNYITHTLPQQCLTSSPTATPTSESSSPVLTQTASSNSESTSEGAAEGKVDPQEEEHELDSDGNDLSTGAFMSFEEWKAMMLKKSGQENLENRPRKEGRREPSPGEDFAVLGEEGEISLDFDAYSDKISEITSATKPNQEEKKKKKEESVEVSFDDGLAHVYRSKDAGKTCKERFSYSSFDAGATVLKTSPGAKNSKAILVENKDSYMLLECAKENKFFIVELSDLILVDTVVLANFEFFSSMIRQFRVSVSDRFPVKLDKWKVLGEYQARNSRDIQPFLIKNPQIWARYVRIEILGHYGKEYYCPISLIRVHGTRMLDSWKEADPSDMDGDLDEEEEPVKGVPEQAEEKAEATEVVIEDVKVTEPVQTEVKAIVAEHSDLTPYWDEMYFKHEYQPTSTCGLDESPDQSSHTGLGEAKDRNVVPAQPPPISTAEQGSHATSSIGSETSSDTSTTLFTDPATSTSSSQTSSATSITNTTGATTGSSSLTVSEPPSSIQLPSTESTISLPSRPSSSNIARNKTTASTSLKHPSSRSPASKASTPTTSRNKTSTVTSSSTSASPTVQDSFFKQLTKRLQTLESNTTLSLQYIESQSKFLQEALSKLERRQVAKVDLFLDKLNKTVLSELREVRTQYDQIWQSTVIALETQREQSEREIVALSSRMGVLADEVVFQKRMAIVQSVLLLGCLVLVIFSRGLASAGMELYYPSRELASQFLGSSSRAASPIYPSTPKGLSNGTHRSSASLRESIEDHGAVTPNRSISRDIDTPPYATRTEYSPNPDPDSASRPPPQRHLSLPDTTRRPSPSSRSISDAGGLEFYQPPTPVSLENGYDSETPVSQPSRHRDYFSPQAEHNGDPMDDVTPGESEPTPKYQAAQRQHAPSSDAGDGTNGTGINGGGTTEYVSGPHRGAARPPMEHVGSSRKPLPALPEDPD
ncbi:UNC-like C-terminal-domain-containing protein [Xylariales sp. AK1849]|nr:UNC-like C-terminal-domain-containing protein [Xylariales sp. AK1849]